MTSIGWMRGSALRSPPPHSWPAELCLRPGDGEPVPAPSSLRQLSRRERRDEAVLGDSAGVIRWLAGLVSAGQKNRDYWRFETERRGAVKIRRARQVGVVAEQSDPRLDAPTRRGYAGAEDRCSSLA